MLDLINTLSRSPAGKILLQDKTRQLDGPGLPRALERFSRTLTKLKIKRLALYADNSIDWVVADLACQKLDICVLPLPAYFTAAQLTHAIRSSGIQYILTDQASSLSALLPELKLQQVYEYSDHLCFLGTEVIETAVELPRETQKITFTSGSTGQPKGVCLSQAQQISQASALMASTGIREPVHLCALPLSTLLENIAGIYAPLLAGGLVHLPSLNELGYQGSRLSEPQAFLNCLSTIKPDTLILIPQLLSFLVQAARQGWPVPSFKFVAVGGSKVSAELISQARQLGIPAYEGYGLSECASVVSLNTPLKDRSGTCGQVLNSQQVTIENGEVLISGNTMLGYIGDSENWYPSLIHSGDLGHLDNQGYLHIDGRCKNILISSYGRNISPEWVESELLASPLLSEAVVFGDSQPYCVALVYPSTQAVSDEQLSQVVHEANKKLPDYARIRAWHRLSEPLTSLPGLMTSNGRPRREQIQEHFSVAIKQLFEKDLHACSLTQPKDNAA
jgi:long-chain acyl-CoA synthetase